MILFYFGFDLLLCDIDHFDHLIKNLVIDGHGVKTHDDPDYPLLDLAEVFEELELTQLGDGYPLGGVSHQQTADYLDSLQANITWNYIETLYHFFV